MIRLWRATMMVSATLSMLVVPLDGATVSGASSTPTCIISLSPSATETLFALGEGPEVKAVDATANYPVGRLPKKRIDGFNPSVEGILAVCSGKPQLVVLSFDANQIQEKLTALGVRVLAQSAPANLASAYRQILQLGSAVHHSKQARVLVEHMRDSITAAIASVPVAARNQRVYYELDPTYYSATSSSFVGSILEAMHVTNIADAKGSTSAGGYPQLSAEYIASANPTTIFLADTHCCGATPQTVSQRVAFGALSAVKKHHVFGLNDDIASRWGPRLVALVRTLARDINATVKKQQ